MSAITTRSETFTKIAKIEAGIGGVLLITAVALIILGNISSLALSSTLLPGYIFVGVGGGLFAMGGITACCPPCCQAINAPSDGNPPTLVNAIIYLPNKPCGVLYLSTQTIQSLFPGQAENRTLEVADQLYRVEEAPLLRANQIGVSDKEKGLKAVPLPILLEACSARLAPATSLRITVTVPSKEGFVYVVNRQNLEQTLRKYSQAFKKNLSLTWMDTKLKIECLERTSNWSRITAETEFDFVTEGDFYFTDACGLASQTTLHFTSELSSFTSSKVAQIFKKVPLQVTEIIGQYVSLDHVWRKDESKNRVTLTGYTGEDEKDLVLVDTLDSPIEVKYTKKENIGLTVVEKLERAGVAGLPEILNQIFQPVLDCQDEKEKGEYQQWGMQLDKGVLLVGPPGTGKTSIGRAIGEILELDESDIRYVKASDIMSKWHGESEGNVAKLFKPSQKGSYFIILADEIEGLIGKREHMQAPHEMKIVAEFLQQIDGMQRRHDFMIIGMTNRPDKIDEAFLRPGRFKRVDIGLPNLQSRIQIFKYYLNAVKGFLAFDIEDEVTNFAQSTENCSGAVIQNIVDQAKMRAFGERRRNPSSAKVTVSDMQLAISNNLPPSAIQPKHR